MNVQLLKRKDFTLLILGKFVSLLGTGMQNFALSLYVLSVTGSGTKFASVLAVGLIPQIVLGPVGGVFADWFDRKKIIVLLDMLSGIIIAIMAAIYFATGQISMMQIYITVISLSTISILFNPAISSVIPSIMKKEELIDANSFNSLVMTIGQFLSPIIAGIIYGVFGLLAILIVNSISFILSSISEMFITIPKSQKKVEKFSINQFHKDFTEGIKFIKTKSILLKLIICSFVINFLFNPIGAVVFPYLSKRVLRVSDIQYGFFEASILIGSLIAPFLSGMIAKKFTIHKIYYWGTIIEGILIGMIGIIAYPNFLGLFNGNLIPYISLILVGIMVITVLIIVNISVMTLFQQQIPIEMMGRVNSVDMTLSMASIPLGQIAFGLLLDNIQTYIIVVSSGIILILVGAAFGYSLKNIKKEEVMDETLDNSLPELANFIEKN
ncbi:MFS transporter [Clostridium sp.]|uniref:MFS transporter n=1 Tax=Clostridium sp. TaxID=1506 RepID=UPI003216FB4D